MISSLKEIAGALAVAAPKTIAVAAAEDADIMQVLREVEKLGVAKFILVGDAAKIRALMQEYGISDAAAEVIDEPDHRAAAQRVVKLVQEGRSDVVMKGNLHTATFLKAVLNKETGLSAGKLISQITVYDKVDGEGLQLMTDCAMAIAPTLEEKVSIIENAVELARRLGIETPKVAMLSALEVVNPKMPDTLEAAVISKMADRGQIKHCVIDGPFALDNAVSEEAARHKGIHSPVAGKADILMAPNLLMGNALFKSLVYFARMETAAVVMGAKAPVVMTSRTDTVQNKVYSVLISLYIS